MTLTTRDMCVTRILYNKKVGFRIYPEHTIHFINSCAIFTNLNILFQVTAFCLCLSYCFVSVLLLKIYEFVCFCPLGLRILLVIKWVMHVKTCVSNCRIPASVPPFKCWNSALKYASYFSFHIHSNLLVSHYIE
jgi:hypothetical protein